MCSTPFGISDSFTTQRDLMSGRRHHVLNAFRHLRSIHSRSWLHSSRRYQSCSTPFGISDPFTLRTICQSRRCSNVLNAFRHLRSIHQHRASNVCLDRVVLNAFRHLRSIHGYTDKVTSFLKISNAVSRTSVLSEKYLLKTILTARFFSEYLLLFDHQESLHSIIRQIICL